MKHSMLLVSFGLSVLSAGCGSNDRAAEGPGSGGANAAAGGADSGVAGQFSSAGDAALSSGGSSVGGSAAGGGTGGTDQTGGNGNHAGNTSLGGAASQGGASGAGQGGGGGLAGGSAALDPTRPPGKNFDLSRFALQLPVANGNSVQQITDLANYTSQYFSTGTDGAMTFWCPVTGAHTPNTHYPRTELRELPIGGDWSITGTHRLTASFKMLQNPPSKGTIIGQIHGNATGGTSEIVKLEWTAGNAIVASVEDNNDGALQINKTIGNYALGSLVSYTLELKDSVLTVSVTDEKGTKTVSNPYTASSWSQDKYYFKFGDYVQLDTGAVTDGGRVAFYSFAIEHGN